MVLFRAMQCKSGSRHTAIMKHASYLEYWHLQLSFRTAGGKYFSVGMETISAFLILAAVSAFAIVLPANASCAMVVYSFFVVRHPNSICFNLDCKAVFGIKCCELIHNHQAVQLKIVNVFLFRLGLHG